MEHLQEVVSYMGTRELYLPSPLFSSNLALQHIVKAYAVGRYLN